MSIQTTVPRTVLYFEAVPLPTSDRGTVFMFIALDHASQYVFNLGVETELSDRVILEKLEALMQDPEFKRHDHPFGVFTYRAPHLEAEMNAIVKPHKGHVQFSEEIVADGIVPFLEVFLKGLEEK